MLDLWSAGAGVCHQLYKTITCQDRHQRFHSFHFWPLGLIAMTLYCRPSTTLSQFSLRYQGPNCTWPLRVKIDIQIHSDFKSVQIWHVNQHEHDQIPKTSSENSSSTCNCQQTSKDDNCQRHIHKIMIVMKNRSRQQFSMMLERLHRNSVQTDLMHATLNIKIFLAPYIYNYLNTIKCVHLDLTGFQLCLLMADDSARGWL